MGRVIVCCGQECEAPSTLDLRGLLSFWLLWELRLGPLLGAQLAERLAWRRGSAVSPGTLYPALASLGRAGAVRRRREGRDTVYALTPAGRRELDRAAGCLRAVFQDVVADLPQTRRVTSR
jgi:DNA-binding PadR family transcriptional regulator